MGLSEDDIKKAKQAKQDEQLGIVKQDESILKKEDIEEIKKALEEDIDIETKLKALKLYTKEIARETLAQRKSIKTEMVFIFDKSGSCENLENTTIEGFMDLIKKQKIKGYNDIITTVLFNKFENVIHDRMSIEDITPFTYKATGSTSLYDTLGHQIIRIKKAQTKDPVSRTIFVIMTDGQDNTSTIYTARDIRNMVAERRNAGWEFIYLGTNLNIEIEAIRLGIKESNAVEYKIDDIENNFKAIEEALDDIHEEGKVNDDWSKPITDSNHILPPSDENKKTKKLTRGNNHE